MATESNEILLLDLGGVLVDLGDPVGAMALDMSDHQFWNIWLNSPSVRAFETGQLRSEEFAKRIADELGVAHRSEFESRLRRWHLPLFPDTEAFIESTAGRYRLALLSNTNEAHWAHVESSTKVFERFDKLFLSFETGYYKPVEQAFVQVFDYFSCEPHDVIFLDDSEGNVAAASALGVRAVRVVGVERAMSALGELSRQRFGLQP